MYTEKLSWMPSPGLAYSRCTLLSGTSSILRTFRAELVFSQLSGFFQIISHFPDSFTAIVTFGVLLKPF